jgi:hypothetical protein
VGGVAGGTWTLGTLPGSYTATASVGGLQAVFNATVKGCTVTVDGIVSAGEWDCAIQEGDFQSFTANVGGDRPAEVRWQQRAGNIYFLVRVQTSDPFELRLDFDNTLNGPSADDDAIGYASNGGFYDQYLTQSCVNRSQAGCGATDRNGKQGAGASAYDGAYRIYELSHPLAGDGVEDFNRAAGDRLGFFLTFKQGNGAKGNSQFPGFRNYKVITIR